MEGTIQEEQNISGNTAGDVTQEENSSQSWVKKISSCFRSFFTSRMGAIFGILIFVSGFLYFYRSQYIAAMVNGRPIFRWQLMQELEKQSGEQVLGMMTTRKLIFQEAKKNDVSISVEEVDKELDGLKKELESQGQGLEEMLSFQGLSEEALREQIRIQLLLEKMAVTEEVSVTEEDVEKQLDQMKDSFPEGFDEETMYATVRAQLVQQEKSKQISAWIEKARQEASVKSILFQ